MRELLKDVKWIFEQKLYVMALIITAICGYGFAIVTPSIGIDDTAVELYIRDGLEVAMGRWTIYLLNKIFHMAKFAPFMMELIGVILLCIGATLFALLLRRILGERIGVVACTIFSCVFVSNPIISELYFFYYHNGVDLGYILVAWSLWLFMDAIEEEGKKKITCAICSMLWAWIAVGCYESLLILYILGIIMVLFLRGIIQKELLMFSYIIKNLALGAVLSIGIVILREMIIEVLVMIFKLQEILGDLPRRGLMEITEVIQHPDGLANFFMLIKRYWVVYFVNAFVYIPIAGYVLAVLIFGGWAIIDMISSKKPWGLFLWIGMLIAPFLLTILEGEVAFYRSCQFMPFFTASGVLLLYYIVCRYIDWRVIHFAIIIFSVILVYNQATELNESFYMEYLKYENAKETFTSIAREIEREYGNELPVIFTGEHEVPTEIVEQWAVPYSSWQYRCIASVTDVVDVHLKEKFFETYGYGYGGEIKWSFVQWSLNAFDDTCGQAIKFLEMHGHSFTTITDKNVLNEAREYGRGMPEWPKDGSIIERNGYILVNI